MIKEVIVSFIPSFASIRFCFICLNATIIMIYDVYFINVMGMVSVISFLRYITFWACYCYYEHDFFWILLGIKWKTKEVASIKCNYFLIWSYIVNNQKRHFPHWDRFFVLFYHNPIFMNVVIISFMWVRKLSVNYEMKHGNTKHIYSNIIPEHT